MYAFDTRGCDAVKQDLLLKHRALHVAIWYGVIIAVIISVATIAFGDEAVQALDWLF